MNILVTGCSGFAGRHLATELSRYNHTILAMDQVFKSPVPEATESFVIDLRKADDVHQVIKDTTPDACIHLGGIAFVPSGDSDPNLMLAVNLRGTINILEGFRQFSPKSRILMVSSGHIYGDPETDDLLTEDSEISPIGMYCISKAAADLTTLAYHKKYKMNTMTVRPNNHIGPGQSPHFSVPSFAQQVKAISNGSAKPHLTVGNLMSMRDFSDVRDIVRGYRLIVEMGNPGMPYNISSPTSRTIASILEELCLMANITPSVEVDPEKYRPTNKTPLLSTARLKKDTGWVPEIDIHKTLEDILKQA